MGVLALLALAACSGGAPRPSPSPAASSTPDDLAALPPDVAEPYRAAREAVRRRDHAEARRLLQTAVGLMPDFTEGWYNLGAASSHLAVEAAGRGEDQAALAFFREGLDAKRRADGLIREGRWLIYNPQQQEQVKSDLAHALEDADEVAANEEALLAALRLHAAAGN
ncbi:MAG TPA: hypothetical protein VF310_00490 [Vicinamibacteria bacterium]